MENVNGRKLVEPERGVDLSGNWNIDWGKTKKDEEQTLGRDGGGISAIGPVPWVLSVIVQRKKRKGRGCLRDAKRMRHSSEPDYDYKDDLVKVWQESEGKT
ncbi:hypothetical protein T459_04524 [Capsicum annuum]|uniref:Uncharacterized protein n=1 Tax=Capsicum annuum TaxID=4072 RepID=A0A2G3A5D9_CAPAN|nr:hypothetical protein T459_04524 [Capsicum annuum]